MNGGEEELEDLLVMISSTLPFLRSGDDPKSTFFRFAECVESARDSVDGRGGDDKLHVVGFSATTAWHQANTNALTQMANPVVQNFVCFQIHSYVFIVLRFKFNGIYTKYI